MGESFFDNIKSSDRNIIHAYINKGETEMVASKSNYAKENSSQLHTIAPQNDSVENSHSDEYVKNKDVFESSTISKSSIPVRLGNGQKSVSHTIVTSNNKMTNSSLASTSDLSKVNSLDAELKKDKDSEVTLLFFWIKYKKHTSLSISLLIFSQSLFLNKI